MTDSWRDDALCAETDPDAFAGETRDAVNIAKAICALCKPEVKAPCLEYALENNSVGVWGGLSDRERRVLRRARRNAA